MFKKYVRNIIVHWITISGVILIAAGTFLACIDQNRRNRYDDKQLHQDIRTKAYQIGKLLIIKNKLLVRINKYQKSLSEKDEIIQQLEARVVKLNITVPKQLSDEEKDASHQVILETEYSDKIAQARSLCNEGKYDEAYKIADNLRQEYPDFGLAYFALGTIEMRRKHYDKGEDLLNKALRMKLSKEDMAWVFHNLGISSLRKNNFEMAGEFLEKAMKLNSNMEESRNALKLLDEYLQKKHIIEQAKDLCNEGKNDEAYEIADNLRQKYPDFGLAYFVLGTIEMRRKRYKKGEDLLNRAIQLGIPDEDAVWAFYNLRISSLQKQDFEKARDFFEKAVKLNANMEESKKTLRFLDDLHSTISSEANIDLRK